MSARRRLLGAARRLLRKVGLDLQPWPARDPWMSDAQWRQLYERLYPAESLTGRRFYNIGAGGFRHWAWTNIDCASDWYEAAQGEDFINLDLMAFDRLPIPDAGAEVFYTSHTIEHVTDAAVDRLFAEVRRCLKPGGTLRIVCPDIDLAWRAYREGDRDYFYWQHYYSRPEAMARAHYRAPLDRASLEQLLVSHFASNASSLHSDGVANPLTDEEVRRLIAEKPQAEALDAIAARADLGIQKRYPGNHINWWNEAKVTAALRRAGFTAIWRSAYGQSRCPPLRDTRHFDTTHPKFSLYVEARG
jgi:SAM-dependent methyltransferase